MRPLTPEDLPACLDLGETAGWPREERKWRLLLELGDGLCIEGDDGRLIASGLVTPMGPELAIIGMMVVDSRHGRQGHGRRILRGLLERLGDTPTFLYASPQGQPLYRALGFEPRDAVIKHIGRLDRIPALDRAIWRAGPDDLDLLAAYDRAATGLDRRDLLAGILRKTVKCIVYPDAANIQGYAIVWDNAETRHIGPVVAADDAIARALILAGLEERRPLYRVDLAQHKEAIAGWLRELGLSPHPPSPLMSLNGAFAEGHPPALYGLAMHATG